MVMECLKGICLLSSQSEGMSDTFSYKTYMQESLCT